MWFLTDDEVVLVLALVRQHVAQTSLKWVVSHIQVRGKRKRVLTWDGIRPWPQTYNHVDCYQRWLPGRKKILRSLALTCKQETLFDPSPARFVQQDKARSRSPAHQCTDGDVLR